MCSSERHRRRSAQGGTRRCRLGRRRRRQRDLRRRWRRLHPNGGAGSDTFHGDEDNDALDGGLGNDTVNGNDGDDPVIHRVGDGVGTAEGGDGHDAFRVQGTNGDNAITIARNAAGVITMVDGVGVTGFEAFEIDGLAGTDTLTYDIAQDEASTLDDVAVDLLSGAATGMSFIRGIENVTSGGGNDTLQGNSLSNRLNGGGGNDLVRGGFGNDDLLGGEGNDNLYGDEGDDVLEGGAGNDRIDGGAGNDTASYEGAAGPVNVTLSSFTIIVDGVEVRSRRSRSRTPVTRASTG